MNAPLLADPPSSPVVDATRDAAPSIVAALNHLRPTDAKPVSYAFPPPPGVPWESAAYDAIPTRIADLRGRAPSIRREGFELRDAPTAVKNFLDDDEVRRVYHPEAAELARAVTGATRAIVFDHLVRRREAGRPGLGFGRDTASGRPGANGHVHNDYTEASGPRRFGQVLADARERDGVRRFGIVNLWRSIKGPVLDAPLAVCDARTTQPAERVTAEVRYPGRTGEIWLLTPSPRHRWAYFSAMDRHEVLAFTQYDSDTGADARFTFHAAFEHPDVPADAPPRESIEVRCLVLYDA